MNIINQPTILYPLIFESLLALFLFGLCWQDFKQTALPKFLKEPPFQHITYAVIFFFFLLWMAQIKLDTNLTIHLLALTTLTLMFGWRIAFLLSIVISGLLAMFGALEWFQLPNTLLFSCFIPIMISHAIYRLSYKYLPHHLFIFIFVAGFFNGAVTITLFMLLNGAYLLSIGAVDWHTLTHGYFSIIPLLAFPEALLNGMACALLCIYAPHWLRYYSDNDYLTTHNDNNE